MIKRPNIKIGFRAVISVILAILTCIMLVTAVSAGDTDKNEITSVTLNKKHTKVTVEISLTPEFVSTVKNSDLYLFELPPHKSENSLSDLTPVETVKPKESISITLPFDNEGSGDRLNSGFLLAQKVSDGSYKIITSVKYIDNPEILAENSDPFPSYSSKKGLAAENITASDGKVVNNTVDAQMLGVRHTVIDVEINNLLMGTNDAEGTGTVLKHSGETYYVHTNNFARLLHQVKAHSESGMAVYLNLVLTPYSSDTHDNIKKLYRSDLSYGARYCALNMDSEYAVGALEALLDYLCKRLAETDAVSGYAPAFIAGYEINSNRTGNSAGPMDLENYVKHYARFFRVVYNTLRSYYSNGQVYVSIANNWTSSVSDLALTPDINLDYGAKEFLTAFSKYIASVGDIPWGVSVNPYKSSDDVGEYWNDTRAKDNAETEFVTMKNINVLTDFLSQNDFLYLDEIRSIIIGEFGVDGRANDTAAINTQAAQYALAYYTAAKNEHIDAFIYSNHFDGSGGEHSRGLRAYTNGTASLDSTLKQPFYNVFSQIDTENSEKITEFVESTAGNVVFEAIMGSDPDYKKFNSREVFNGTKADEAELEGKYNVESILDYSDDRYSSFYFYDNTLHIEAIEEDDYTVLYSGFGKAVSNYSGIGNSNLGDRFERAQYITLEMMPQAPAGVEGMTFVLMLQYDGDVKNDSAVFLGEAELKANEWSKVSFDIREFIKESDGSVDSLKLLWRTSDGETVSGDYGFYLKSADLHLKKGMPIIVKLLLILLIAAAILVAAYGVLYLRAQLIRKKRRTEAQRRRVEALKLQAQRQAQASQQPGMQNPAPANMTYPRPQANRPPMQTRPMGAPQNRPMGQAPQKPVNFPNNRPIANPPQYRQDAGNETRVFSTTQINQMNGHDR